MATLHELRCELEKSGSKGPGCDEIVSERGGVIKMFGSQTENLMKQIGNVFNFLCEDFVCSDGDLRNCSSIDVTARVLKDVYYLYGAREFIE